MNGLYEARSPGLGILSEMALVTSTMGYNLGSA